jgi:alpha-L-fucosidase
VIFSDIGPDVRWVGNERGIAGDPCWATYDPVGSDGGVAGVGNVRERDSPTGTRHGSHWLPAECDVSIRPGWFWHERENEKVKTPQQLIDLYYQSVGRGASLLLNVPPNRDGLLSLEDVASLKAFGDYRRATFSHNLAAGARVKRSGSNFTYDLRAEVAFDVIRIREDIGLGQRIDAFDVDAWIGGRWVTVAKATSIGPRRLIRLDHHVTARRVRLRVTEASASPVIAEFALFSGAGL